MLVKTNRTNETSNCNSRALTWFFARFPIVSIVLLVGALLGGSSDRVLAASYDCAKARTKVEHLVCETPLLSTLDETLAKDYQELLAKANEEQNRQVMKDQRHWLSHTRNACRTVTCLKHAYWSRQAELETYFQTRSPLYKDEYEKTERIKEVLETAHLKRVYDHQICKQIYEGLIHKKGVEFINPTAQAQSYEDPAFDPWKNSCKSAPPFNFSFFCEPRIEPISGDDVVEACKVSYGLPPFKIYVLPPLKNSKESRTIFYNNDSYGFMNRNYRKKTMGSGFVGFRQINPTKCLSMFGNRWDTEGKVDMGGLSAYLESNKSGPNEENYNSLIRYKNDYYFMILYKKYERYWLTVKPVAERKGLCRWIP